MIQSPLEYGWPCLSCETVCNRFTTLCADLMVVHLKIISLSCFQSGSVHLGNQLCCLALPDNPIQLPFLALALPNKHLHINCHAPHSCCRQPRGDRPPAVSGPATNYAKSKSGPAGSGLRVHGPCDQGMHRKGHDMFCLLLCAVARAPASGYVQKLCLTSRKLTSPASKFMSQETYVRFLPGST